MSKSYLSRAKELGSNGGSSATRLENFAPIFFWSKWSLIILTIIWIVLYLVSVIMNIRIKKLKNKGIDVTGKLEKYEKALDDAYKANVLKPESAKAWGRVGSCLLALNKKEESYEAFYKASQLEPTNEHYKSLCKTENLDQLIEELKELKKNKGPSIEGLLGPLFSKMMNNKKLIQLATNPSFNLAKYKDNPLDAMNNPDIMDLVSDVLGELNMNKKN